MFPASRLGKISTFSLPATSLWGALDFATAASAYKHTLKGDFNWATVDDVEALMSGNISGRVKR